MSTALISRLPRDEDDHNLAVGLSKFENKVWAYLYRSNGSIRSRLARLVRARFLRDEIISRASGCGTFAFFRLLVFI